MRNSIAIYVLEKSQIAREFMKVVSLAERWTFVIPRSIGKTSQTHTLQSKIGLFHLSSMQGKIS